MGEIFRRADILLPQNCDLHRWSVVACDQFTSDPAYWAALDAEIGDAPSALRLILPEAYLEGADLEAESGRIDAAMEEYLNAGLFRELPGSYVYLERTLRIGVTRRGLLGALDLEQYDYRAEATTPVRATEGTVESRLPARMRIRAGAALELPHVMVFLDDPTDAVIGGCAGARESLEPLYDVNLLAEGGQARGWRVSGPAADRVDAALAALTQRAEEAARLEGRAPLVFAMGDGNHSLATAKRCWEELKPTLTAEQRAHHPARWSLVELVNIHDPSITFEPIHRVAWSGNPAAFLDELRAHLVGASEGAPRLLRVVTPEGETLLSVPAPSIGALIGETDAFLSAHLARWGGKLDYVHNDEAALELARSGCCALLLPKLEKAELFPSVARSGAFPRKSFSIGRAEDKRYYLEARRIKP